jgi:hypothetical protein
LKRLNEIISRDNIKLINKMLVLLQLVVYAYSIALNEETFDSYL